MNPEYVHVVFDFDGTLWDSKNSVYKSLKYALISKGCLGDKDQIKPFEIGPPIEEVLEKDYGLGSAVTADIAKIFRQHFAEEDRLNSSFFDGAIKLLELMYQSGYILSIATFKREKLVRSILKDYKIDHYFSGVFGLNENSEIRSKTILVQKCTQGECLGSVLKTVVVGDTYGDYKAALDNGLSFYFAQYGYGSLLADSITLDEIEYLSTPMDVLNLLERGRVHVTG